MSYAVELDVELEDEQRSSEIVEDIPTIEAALDAAAVFMKRAPAKFTERSVVVVFDRSRGRVGVGVVFLAVLEIERGMKYHTTSWIISQLMGHSGGFHNVIMR